MAGQLKPAQAQQRHKISDVQAVGTGIESAIEGQRSRRLLLQLRSVRAIGDQPAPLEFFQDAHEPPKLSRLGGWFTRANCSLSGRCLPAYSEQPRRQYAKEKRRAVSSPPAQLFGNSTRKPT